MSTLTARLGGCWSFWSSFHVEGDDLVGLVAASAASHLDSFLDLEVSSLALRAFGKSVPNNRVFPLYRLQRSRLSGGSREIFIL